mmetsp:Transcript_4083/g.13209  ORF Transcript_4083/g.13209 Transcript_4083/m.13209 type:complete len:255 (+) Transcript_4083:1490-2254(+)
MELAQHERELVLGGQLLEVLALVIVRVLAPLPLCRPLLRLARRAPVGQELWRRRRRADERDEVDAAHVLLQHVWYADADGRLVVFNDAAHGALGGDQCRVEHVAVLLLAVVGLCLAESHLEAARLVVGAVGAGDELAVRVRAGEPRLEVVLLGRRVVELARDDVDDLVRDAQRLVEVHRGLNHPLLLVPRRPPLGRGDGKLLHLFKLVHAEDAELVAPVRARLLAEAGGVARVPLGQLFVVDPLSVVVGANRLL